MEANYRLLIASQQPGKQSKLAPLNKENRDEI
jgi:hypothetical protein